MLLKAYTIVYQGFKCLNVRLLNTNSIVNSSTIFLHKSQNQCSFDKLMEILMRVYMYVNVFLFNYIACLDTGKAGAHKSNKLWDQRDKLHPSLQKNKWNQEIIQNNKSLKVCYNDAFVFCAWYLWPYTLFNVRIIYLK